MESIRTNPPGCGTDALQPYYALHLAVPRGPRLDALPLFVRSLRSRSLPGILGPALRPGSLTGVLHHVIPRGTQGRALAPGHLHRRALSGGVEKVDAIDSFPDYAHEQWGITNDGRGR